MSTPDFVKILEVKRYSKNTINVYASVVKLAQGYFNKPLSHVSESELHSYFYHLVNKKNASFSYQKQMVMALKHYYREILNQSINIEFLLPKRKEEKLPVILSFDEVNQLIKVAGNIKHQCMIALVYSAGLRIGELINMRVHDIGSQRMVIHIKQAKGRKDRIVPLSEKLLIMLRDYYKQYTPKAFLFEGQKGGSYTTSSFNKLLKSAARRAKINKKFSAHALRHSYATHLLVVNCFQMRSIHEHQKNKR